MPEFLSGDFFVGLSLVLVTNVILSGDNAVVIAMAARRLEGANRRKAIILGALGAVGLRLVFAAIVIYLLEIPFLQMVGGLLLFWIAWRLILEDPEKEERVRAGESTWEVVKIIILADAVMSLDNVVALVGAAEGDFLLLAIGIATTIPLVIFGSTLLAFLLERFPLLVYTGAGLLVYIAVEMFFEDVALQEYLEPYVGIEWLVNAVAVSVFLAVA
ncbi:MAG TPA: TerC family protein, partial [Rubrobacteraceae bacterium]|nr:TerC family protein [Rubrobacteraceae bacterium]